MHGAFIEFDLSSLPAGSTVLSARITLWAEYRDGQIHFEPVASAWDEMSITWANQPTTLPPQVSYPISRGEPDGPCYWGCSWPFDISSIVQYWASDPQSNFGLRVAANTGSIGWLMASSDNVTHPRPKLTVLYTGPDAVEATTWGKTKEQPPECLEGVWRRPGKAPSAVGQEGALRQRALTSECS